MLLRKEPKWRNDKESTDCIIESVSDLQSEELEQMGYGSLAYCLGDNKLYVKTSNGWTAIGGGGE